MKEPFGSEVRPEVLVRELEAGGEQAFNYLFTTRYEELCRFARAFVGLYSVAEDVVQEVFVRIWENGLRLTGSTSLDSYLYVAVRNGCVSYLRKHRSFHPLEEARGFAEEFPDSPEELKRIWLAVEALPLQCRAILRLVVLEEMKYQEVADKLGISINTVKGQLKKAYRTLREKLDRKAWLFFLCLSAS